MSGGASIRLDTGLALADGRLSTGVEFLDPARTALSSRCGSRWGAGGGGRGGAVIQAGHPSPRSRVGVRGVLIACFQFCHDALGKGAPSLLTENVNDVVGDFPYVSSSIGPFLHDHDHARGQWKERSKTVSTYREHQREVFGDHG